MSLCCCCSTATGRGVLLPSLLLGRRHWTGHHLLNLRATTTVVSSSSAAATSSLSPPQQRQITVYVDTLLEWNQRMNLTAVTDEAEVMARHVADSLAMLPPLERVYRGRSTSAGGAIDGVRLIDVGSGAGLPGWKFTLLESMRKRCTFLEHAVEAMNLSNVDVVCDRAEDRKLAKVLISEKVMI
ncbi:S-adenosyl-L-methionine-dependent methyltransferase superfamily protein [Zea mays]|uniref:S-adenosyl-L-methionine-dependent methyltransferase superfamily protein n=1 Tax=Zea mays TaxID=4577 RepID=A0A1D6LW07_MAIZE|nr:S-adenosyl-L-methionine-dependent methyltransferase superfamily protein [Zea mays]